jgi:hypothetical protein
MIEFNYEEKLNTLINICILITFVFCIILIIDELYNIIKFSFNYTHLYNLGSFTEKFNKDKTIEMETKRYSIYNNIENLVLYKDIYNKSYLNYSSVIFCIEMLRSLAEHPSSSISTYFLKRSCSFCS